LIRFWHVPKEHSRLADRLTKAAAVLGDEVRIYAQGARNQSMAHVGELQTTMPHAFHTSILGKALSHMLA
jgi:uncharacterized protein Veg